MRIEKVLELNDFSSVLVDGKTWTVSGGAMRQGKDLYRTQRLYNNSKREHIIAEIVKWVLLNQNKHS